MEHTGQSVQRFFDEYYANYRAGDNFQRWRVLLARVNAEKIIRLLARSGRPARNVVELGCGGGELLAELSRWGVGESYVAYEISRSAVEYVRSQAIRGVRAVEIYDGTRTPEEGGSFDLAIVSHVIEHAHDPIAVLREARRLAPTVAMQILLADTLPARRLAHRHETTRTGHLHEYNLTSARAAVASASLDVVVEAVTHPGRRLRTYWHRSTRSQAVALVIDAAFAVAPPLARRLFASDYTAICVG
jgi:SAM-dependent methyltransferase